MIIVTTEDFKKRASILHGNKYDYSKSVYIKSDLKVKIVCPIHGIFLQRPNTHLCGSGCPKCAVSTRNDAVRLTTEEFVERSLKIHGEKYDYSCVIYKKWEGKVKIKCNKHGIFEQGAGDHLMGEGCWLCGHERCSSLQKQSLDFYISKANIVHKGKYVYSKVQYKNNRTKIEIVCPIHGEFFQVPTNHLKGYGCIKCSREKEHQNYLKDFIARAKKIHGDFYDYSESHDQVGDKIKIICPTHGKFYQHMYAHLNGSGCRKCILKEESKLGVIIGSIFSSDWKIDRHKKIYSKEHGRNRIFDFFLSKGNTKIIIEYDGLQHFKPVRFCYNMTVEQAKRKFIAQTETDRLDPLFCQNNDIKLYRISYKDKMEKCVKNICGQSKI